MFVLAGVGLLSASPALAQPPTEVGRAVKMDVSPPLRSIPPAKPAARSAPVWLGEDSPMAFLAPGALSWDEAALGGGASDEAATDEGMSGEALPVGAAAPGSAPPDPVRQVSVSPLAAGPSALTNWEGVANSENTFIVSPKAPDAEGDVGPNDYVQWVNLKFKIWSKSGSLRYGPASGNTLWSGLGGPCQEYNWGDPQVTFDRIANRWVFMQYAFPTNFTEPIPPYYLCFAVSKTSDPTGSYYRYAFRVPDYFPDYGKLGVWPDGYYLTTNNSEFGHASKGAAVYAFDRSKMLDGDPSASFIEYQQDPFYRYLLPANFSGSTLPPDGAPEYFAALEPVHCGISCSTMFGSRIWLWRFHADFAVPSNSSFSGPTSLPVTPYQSLCMLEGCIPQPGTEQKVDAGSDHLMQRLEYRNFGGHESLVTTHTVNAGGGVAGMRWYEIQVSPPGGTPSVAEESTYAPNDGIHRWMGSVAMDGPGDVALGYSMSNGSNEYPSVGYTGSASGSGVMGLGETTMVKGGGSETSTGRWGDYSAMSIDPSDDETFWYTQEYYAATSSLGWTTRVGSFRLAQGPSATLTEVNGSLAVFPYVTDQSVSSVAGGCSAGEGAVSWSVSGAASEGGSASCSGGTWTAALTSPLSSDGSYTLSAAQGVASSPSQTLTIDTTTPNPPVLTALPPNVRNGQSLTATSVSDNGGGSGVKQVNYLYCAGASCTPATLIGSSSAAAGNYAVTWSDQPAGGTYRVMAQTEDNAGYTANSAIQTIVIDNTQPAVSLSEVNGGPVAFPHATKENVTSIGGSCGTASGDIATVDWSVSGPTGESGSAPCGAEAWSAAVPLSAEGNYTLLATQSDEAGNTGSSGNRSLTIDTTAPNPPTLTALPAYIRNGQSLTATSVSDNGGGSGIEQVSYFYCAGPSCTPSTPIGSSSKAAGGYAVIWNEQPANGGYRVMAQVEDKAGNTADSTIQSTFVDNVPPPVSLSQVNGGEVAFPYDTNQSVILIGGSCSADPGDAAGVSWTVSGAASESGSATCSGGVWSATVSLSADGAYTLSATQSDEAGNTGSSGSRSLTIRDLPPIASFSFSPASPHVGQVVLFNGTRASDPDGTVSSYAWSFGDGADASGETASHVYPEPGVFTTQLSVTDDSGSVGISAQSLSVSSVTRRHAPVVSLKIPKQRLRLVLTRGLFVVIFSNQTANAMLRLMVPPMTAKTFGLGDGKRAISIATKGAQLLAGKPTALRVVLSRLARHHLWRAKSVTLRLTVVATGRGGKTSLRRRLALWPSR